MTLLELQEQCWAAMPPIRKRIVGREVIDDFVVLAIENWEATYLMACRDNHEKRVFQAAMLGHLKRGHQIGSGYDAAEYGFLWAFVLQAVAAAVIQWLVTWWLERNANRVLMEGWRLELTT